MGNSFPGRLPLQLWVIHSLVDFHAVMGNSFLGRLPYFLLVVLISLVYEYYSSGSLSCLL